jgi:signal recognition particle GTPase
LNDFLAQIQQMKQMGGLSSLMDKLPAAMTAKAGRWIWTGRERHQAQGRHHPQHDAAGAPQA